MFLVMHRATAFTLFSSPALLGRNLQHATGTRRYASCLPLRSFSTLYRKSSDDIDSTAMMAAPSDDDLTEEELASRFVEVLAHYQKSKEMSADQVCSSMLRTRLPQLRLNRCVVAPSTVPQAGLGLFASRNVSAQELLTLYPGDALIQWDRGVGDFGGDVGVLFGNHVIDRDASRVTTDEARGYELKIQERQSLVADPNLMDDAAYLGHMINDGAALLSETNSSRTVYSQDTFDRHNAAFQIVEGCHLVVVATRDMMEGEEIFVSYGEDYWLSRSHGGSSAKSSRRAAGAPMSTSSKSRRGTSRVASTKKASKKKAKGATTSRGGGGFG